MKEMQERIRQIRKRFHLTQRELAGKMGVSVGFISLLETGRSGLSDENIEKLCGTLHISAAWLRDGIGDMESENPENWLVVNETEEEKRERNAGQSARIRELRKTLRLSQLELGEKTGYSREMIARIEQCLSSASEKLLQRIEDEFRVNADWLRYGKGEMFREERKAAEADEAAAEPGNPGDQEPGEAEADMKIINEFLLQNGFARKLLVGIIRNGAWPGEEN